MREFADRLAGQPAAGQVLVASTQARSPWLLNFRPRPEADLRLVCFGPAGGGASFFRRWPDAAPAHVETLAVQLPGRETRLTEPAEHRVGETAERVAEALASLPARDTLLFGHSMGALLALEVAERLMKGPSRHMIRLVVSGREAPDLAIEDPGFASLPDVAFLEAVSRRYGGVPRLVLEEPELRDLITPILRADFAAVLAYRRPSRPALDLPLTVFRGVDDPETRDARIAGWLEVSARPVRIRDFPGGHFFLVDQTAAVVAELVREFERGDAA